MTPQGLSTGWTVAQPAITVPSPARASAESHLVGGGVGAVAFAFIRLLHFLEGLVGALDQEFVPLVRSPPDDRDRGSRAGEKPPVLDDEGEREHVRPPLRLTASG